MSWLIYGANGYTGELIARKAAASGLSPHLAGRSRGPVERLASELGLQGRVFDLDAPAGVDRGLEDVGLVLHCAGPFSRTSRPMADACLRRSAHYLDITGEVEVFESLAARDGEARARGVMLLPGAGFDVVPSDCLAAHLKGRLPSATRLRLGFQSLGRLSRGTATTLVENLHRGGLVRRGGVLVRVPAAYQTRVVDFGRGPRTAVTIPWGDVSTAFHSTAIPDIEVYLAAPRALRWALLASRFLKPALRSGPVQRFLKRRIQAGPPGPSQEERTQGRTWLWGEALDPAGRRAVSRLRTPEAYELTVLTALMIVDRALAGEAPSGFQTPSRAYGPDLVLRVPSVERRDEPLADSG
jgi:short subunit dehydrogenase-like uncharacterized protein